MDKYKLNLDSVFSPQSIAFIGASSSFAKWGQMILSNILAGDFRRNVFPVNTREELLYGLPVYRRVQDISEPVDLAFVTTPAHTVPSILEGCGEKGVKGAVVITSGFSETDQRVKTLEEQIVSI